MRWGWGGGLLFGNLLHDADITLPCVKALSVCVSVCVSLQTVFHTVLERITQSAANKWHECVT